MKIKNIHIDNFGKFENFNIDFKDDIQIIYGENEAGKSTLMDFIKLMFYRKEGYEKASAKDKEIREKYYPRSKKEMKGSIEFESHGTLFKIYKEIDSKSPSKDSIIFKNLSTDEQIKLGKKEEIGEYIFGIDAKSFEKSSFVKTLGKIEVPKDKGDISDKIIASLSETDDENISKDAALKRIKAAIDDIKPSKKKSGKILNVENEISEIKSKINELNNVEKNNNELKKELDKINTLKNQKIETEKELELLRKNINFFKIKDIIKTNEIIDKKSLELNIPFEKAYGIIENLTSKKQELDKCLAKKSELENINNLVTDESEIVSDEDIDKLDNLLKEKYSLENKIHILNEVLQNHILSKNPDFNALKNSEISDLDIVKKIEKNYKSHKNVSDKIQSLKNSIQSAKESFENKIKKSKNEALTKNTEFKKILMSTSILLGIGLILSFCLSVFLGNIFPILGTFLALIIFGLAIFIFKFKKSNDIQNSEMDLKSKLENKLNELNNQIEKYSFEAKNNFDNTKFIIENEINHIRNNIKKVNNDISADLKEKKCSSVQDFYQSNAKYKSAYQIKNSMKIIENKIEEISKEIISTIQEFKPVQDLNSAVKTLNFVSNLLIEINNLKNQNAIKLNSLGIPENLSTQELQNYISKPENLNLKSLDEITSKIQIKEKQLQKLQELNLDEKYIEIKKNIKTPNVSKEHLKKELEKKESELSNLNDYLESLNLAAKNIEDAYDELRRNFSPKLNEKASKIFSELTSKKYSKISIEKNYNILINSNNWEYDHKNFSTGTIDQAYFALRLAISELISGKSNIPIILDDIFARYDDKRTENSIELLKNYSKNRQVIIFTCHKSMLDIAKLKNIFIIKI